MHIYLAQRARLETSRPCYRLLSVPLEEPFWLFLANMKTLAGCPQMHPSLSSCLSMLQPVQAVHVVRQRLRHFG